MARRLAHEWPDIIDIPGELDAESIAIVSTLFGRRAADPAHRHIRDTRPQIRQYLRAKIIQRVEVREWRRSTHEGDTNAPLGGRREFLEVNSVCDHGDARRWCDARQRRAVRFRHRDIQPQPLAPPSLNPVHQTSLQPKIPALPPSRVDCRPTPQQDGLDIMMDTHDRNVAERWKISRKIQAVDMNQIEGVRAKQLADASAKGTRIVQVAGIHTRRHDAPQVIPHEPRSAALLRDRKYLDVSELTERAGPRCDAPVGSRSSRCRTLEAQRGNVERAR